MSEIEPRLYGWFFYNAIGSRRFPYLRAQRCVTIPQTWKLDTVTAPARVWTEFVVRLNDVFHGVDDTIYYCPRLAKLLKGAHACLVFSRLLQWTGHQHDRDGWIYKTQDELCQETGLTKTEQRTARKRLRDMKVLEERYARLGHQLYFRIDLARAQELWDTSYSTSSNLPVPNPDSELPEIEERAVAKTLSRGLPSQVCTRRQSIHIDNTSTSEKTTADERSPAAVLDEETLTTSAIRHRLATARSRNGHQITQENDLEDLTTFVRERLPYETINDILVRILAKLARTNIDNRSPGGWIRTVIEKRIHERWVTKKAPDEAITREREHRDSLQARRRLGKRQERVEAAKLLTQGRRPAVSTKPVEHLAHTVRTKEEQLQLLQATPS